MGAGSSSEVPGGGSEGYHVLRVQEGSPGYKAGLEPFFDFIISVEDRRLDQDDDTLKEVLKTNVEKPCKLLVYSSKTRKVRESSITPSNLWGGQGLLGVSIRFCSFDGASDNVWHVLDVNPNSPADIAGLRPHTDYVIGADQVLHDTEDFFNLIEQHEGKALKLYVYNAETDGCREVTITPNGNWGGEGSIGCGIGYGLLHRIPVPDQTVPLKPPMVAPSTAGIGGFSEIPLQGGSVPLHAGSLDGQMAAMNLSSTNSFQQPPPPMTAPLLTNNLPPNNFPPTQPTSFTPQPPMQPTHFVPQQHMQPTNFATQPPMQATNYSPQPAIPPTNFTPQSMTPPPSLQQPQTTPPAGSQIPSAVVPPQQNISPMQPPPQLQPNLPTIMSTSTVGSYQPATLVATESAPLHTTPTQPTINGYQANPPINSGETAFIQPQYQTQPMQPAQPPSQLFAAPPQLQTIPSQYQQDPNVILAKTTPSMTDISLDGSPQMIQHIPSQLPAEGEQNVNLT